MITIQRIEITGFKDPNRAVMLDFSQEPITVIYGENGSGKSTLLKILYGVLSQDDSILQEERVQSATIFYTLKDPNEVDKKVYAARVWLEEEEDDDEPEEYNWSEFQRPEFSENSSIIFGVHRGITMSNTNVDLDTIMRFIMRGNYFSYFESRFRSERFAKDLVDYINHDSRMRRRAFYGRRRNPFEQKHLLLDHINIEVIEEALVERYRQAKIVASQRVQKALFDTLSLAINPQGKETNERDKIPNDFSELVLNNKERLIEALSSSAENTLRDQIIEILKTFNKDEFDRRHSKNELLSSLLYKMILELEIEYVTLNSINILIKVFNDQISKHKKLVVTSEEAYIDLGYDRHHVLSELSSGEKHLLSFLTLFIIEGSKRDFLMIDEPEISLNIKWQRKLLPLLSELAPKAQIIVASHSPSVAKQNTNYLVELKS